MNTADVVPQIIHADKVFLTEDAAAGGGVQLYRGGQR